MQHRFDEWFWCRRCGLGAMEAMKSDTGDVCIPPPPGILAQRQLDAIVARSALVRMADAAIARIKP